MTNEQIIAIKLYQKLFQNFHPIVQEQLQILPLAVFKDAKHMTLELTPQTLLIKLEPYRGFRGLINQIRYNKKHAEWTNYLIKIIDFWLFADSSGHKPEVRVEWV